MEEDKNKAMTPDDFHRTYHQVRRELSRVVVGQDEAIAHLLTAVFAGGHVLLTGMPGLGRTLLVKALAQALGLEFRRLQFTPDLLPTDIIGAEILENNAATGARAFRFFKGPVFANLVLADEINRAPTRTQSALLEVMQERQVTSGGQTYFLPSPYILVATQNTLDSDGIWHLGEAQTDRFMMSIRQGYPDLPSERQMLLLTTGTHRPSVAQVTDPQAVLAMQKLAREAPVPPSVRDFALAIVRASRPGQPDAAPEADAAVRLGGSPRAAQALLLGAKVTALASGRTHVSRQDVIEVAPAVMAHRLLLDFRAQADGATVEAVLEALISRAREQAMPVMSRWTRRLLRKSTA